MENKTLIDRLVALGYQKEEADNLMALYIKCGKTGFLEEYVAVKESLVNNKKDEEFIGIGRF